jgi:replicative DNA helicase
VDAQLLEFAVIKSAVTDKTTIPKLKIEGLTADYFVWKEAGKSKSPTEWLFSMALDYHTRSGGSLLTSNVVASEMISKGLKDDQRGKMMLLWQEIQDTDIDPNDLYLYIQQMKHDRFIKVFAEMQGKSHDVLASEGEEAAVKKLREYAFELERIKKGNSSDEACDYTQAAEIMQRIVEEARAASAKGELGIKSGFKYLDEVTFGFMPEELIVFVAPSGGGKSTQLLNIAIHAHDIQGMNVLYFSLELGRTKTLRRHSACLFGISHNSLRSGEVSDSDLRRIIDGMNQRKDGAYFIYDYTDDQVTAEYIEQRISQVTYERGRPDLVVIDYIGLMGGVNMPPNTKDAEKVGYAAEECAKLCKKIQLPFVTAAQFNRVGMAEKRNAKAKSKAFEFAQDMVAGSSRLVHWASMIIGIDPDVVEKTNAYFPVKMRDGSFVPFITKYAPATFQILDVADEDQSNWRSDNGINNEAPVAGINQKGPDSSETNRVFQETDGSITVSKPGGEINIKTAELVAEDTTWDFEFN